MRKITKLLILISFCSFMNQLSASEKEIFIQKFKNFEIILLSEGQQNGNPNILLDAPAEIVKKYAPEGTFPNATNAFLVKISGKNILVDAGVGKNLASNLAEFVKNEDIHAILLTHLHGDHIGGLLADGKAVFANADVYLSQKEFDYWMKQGNENAKKVLEVYKDKLKFFEPSKVNDAKKSQLMPNILPIAAYGHTPGHTTFLVEANNEKVLIWGDLTHAMAVQMPNPEIAVTYDVDPKTAIKSRQEILKFVAENEIPIAGMHIAFPAIGKITKAGAGYSFEAINKE
jgi:glyoxylase-like metal-dependent hydrolase (beta-lactamase superfamily II)